MYVYCIYAVIWLCIYTYLVINIYTNICKFTSKCHGQTTPSTEQR